MANLTYLISGSTGEWEVVVGLEVHAQVISALKPFSGAATAFGAEAKTQISLVGAVLWGMLPVPRRSGRASRSGRRRGGERCL